ncbi:hypothetical protein [Vibrio harveyi]|uniref:hypothetical protein n=1 Tax=Vibrio harveyi TaxID=669 RepID=UPI003CEB1CB2
MELQHLEHISALCCSKDGVKGPLYGLPIVIFLRQGEVVHACIRISGLLGFDALGLRTVDYLKDFYDASETHLQDAEWFGHNMALELSSQERAKTYENIQACTGLRPKDLPLQFKCPSISFSKKISILLSVGLQFKVEGQKIVQSVAGLSNSVSSNFCNHELLQLIINASDLASLLTIEVDQGKLNQDEIIKVTSELLEELQREGEIRANYEDNLKLSYQFKVNCQSLGMDFSSFIENHRLVLRNFSTDMETLNCYNHLQELAMDAVIALAQEDFLMTRAKLTELLTACEGSRESFLKSALKYQGMPMDLTAISREIGVRATA